MNFLDCVVESSQRKKARVSVPKLGNVKLDVVLRDGAPAKGDVVKVGLRPEHFLDGKIAKTKFEAKTSVVEQLGGVSYLYLDLGEGQQLTVEQKGHSDYRDGDIATIGVDADRAMLFDAGGLRL